MYMDKAKPACYIFAAGEYYGAHQSPREGDFVIAADGGYDYVKSHGLRPNLVVGDFDSLAAAPDEANVLTLPQEKDDTDMVAALRQGLERGFDRFYIYGGTGGRLDHTLANLQCLVGLAHRGARGFLAGDGVVITAIKNSSLAFEGGVGTVSVFSHTDAARGVCETGFKYPLDNATLSNGFPLGVSNQLLGRPARISVEDGVLVIIYPWDAALAEGS